MRIRQLILCVIVFLVCISIFPSASAGAIKSDSVTITAKVGDITLSADFTSDVTEGSGSINRALSQI